MGRRHIGNGFLLTAYDRYGNDAAYQLAKEAVCEQRVPRRIRVAIAEQERLVSEMAWWVTRVTVTAKFWGPNELRDSDSAVSKRGS